jgi:hypothetical protein
MHEAFQLSIKIASLYPDYLKVYNKYTFDKHIRNIYSLQIVPFKKMYVTMLHKEHWRSQRGWGWGGAVGAPAPSPTFEGGGGQEYVFHPTFLHTIFFISFFK